MRDICIKNPNRKIKGPPTVQVGGNLSALMLGKDSPTKYDDLGNPTIIVQMGKIIPNTLVDLGATIDIMNKETLEQLGLPNLILTLAMLELANRSKI